MPGDDKHPNLADPNFEPTDEQLQELSRRAFAGVAETHARALKALHERIAVMAEEALSKWRAEHPHEGS